MECVNEVFPDATVITNCVEKFPIRVIVDAHVGDTKIPVWEGNQKDLFRKYSNRREKAKKEIKENLETFKEDVLEKIFFGIVPFAD